MTDSQINTFILGGIFLLLFGSAELFYRILGCKAEVTRKYVHIATGLLTLLFPPLIGDHWLVFILCGSFFVILLASLKLKILPSINAIDRKSWGSLAYPLIVYTCFLIYLKMDHLMYYYIPILILALCDPIANIVGKNWPAGKYAIMAQTKTMSGSAAFCIASFTTTFVLLYSFSDLSFHQMLILSIIVAIVSTLAEAVSLNGFDNITIPSSAITVLFIFDEFIFNL